MIAGGGRDVVWRFISQISFIKCTVINLNSSLITHQNDSFQLGDFKCWSSASELISTMWTPVEPIILVIILVFPSFDFCFLLDFAFCLKIKLFVLNQSQINCYDSCNITCDSISPIPYRKSCFMEDWQYLPFGYKSKDWTAN